MSENTSAKSEHEHFPMLPRLINLAKGVTLVAGMDYRILFRSLRIRWVAPVMLGLCGLLALIFVLPALRDIAFGIPLSTAYRGEELFNSMVWLIAVPCVLLTPAVLGIARERDRQTLEALLLTRLTSGELIGGKWLAVLRIMGILSLGPLALMAAAMVMDGALPIQFLIAALVILAMVACLAAMGLYIATFFTRSGTALSVGYAACGVWVFLIPVLVWLDFDNIAIGVFIIITVLALGTIAFGMGRGYNRTLQSSFNLSKQHFWYLIGLSFFSVLLFVIPVIIWNLPNDIADYLKTGTPLGALHIVRKAWNPGSAEYSFYPDDGQTLAIVIQTLAATIFLVLATNRLETERRVE